jgi:hypothetical protein
MQKSRYFAIGHWHTRGRRGRCGGWGCAFERRGGRDWRGQGQGAQWPCWASKHQPAQPNTVRLAIADREQLRRGVDAEKESFSAPAVFLHLFTCTWRAVA